MNKNIEHYLFHKENFLDEKYCDNSINELNKCTWQKHEWYTYRTDESDTPQGGNEPEVLFHNSFTINIEEINTFILQELRLTMIEYIESLKFSWYDGWEGYSEIKFIRYYPGQTMKNHCDHIHGLFDGERRGIPTLSIIGVLNDDYEGGELIMFEDKKIDTKKGDLVIFPSNFMYPHEIMPVTKGVRYSYVSWVW